MHCKVMGFKHRAANNCRSGFRQKSCKCMEFWRIPLQVQTVVFRSMRMDFKGVGTCEHRDAASAQPFGQFCQLGVSLTIYESFTRQ